MPFKSNRLPAMSGCSMAPPNGARQPARSKNLRGTRPRDNLPEQETNKLNGM
jgi:hypothetical protein